MKYYVLTVSGLLIKFNTHKEAKEYTKGFPKGTYKIDKLNKKEEKL